MRLAFVNWRSALLLAFLSRYIAFFNPTITLQTRKGTVLDIPPGDRTWWSSLESFPFDCYRLKEIEDSTSFTFLDVGANIGTFSLAVAERFEGAVGIAIEPVPLTFRFLRRNLAQNGIGGSVAPEWGAITSQGETMEIHWNSRDSSTASSLLRGGIDAVAISVPAFRLEDVVESFDDGIDLVKIDIEGAEYGLLTDIVSLVQTVSIRRLIIEYHDVDGHGVPEILAALSRSPMKPVRIDQSSTAGVGLIFFDRGGE